MESSIKLLDHRTDEATKMMLQNAVKRKRKWDKLKEWHLLFMWGTIIFAFMNFIYLYYSTVVPYSYSFAAIFSAYVSDSLNFYLLVFIMGAFGFMNVLRQKRDKAEKEYHAIRCEIIDKSKDLWKKEDEWKNRHQVFEMMLKNFDVNLYHENK